MATDTPESTLIRAALALVREALELPEDARVEWIASRCEGRPDLQREALALLALEDTPPQPFESATETPAPELTRDPWPGQRLGRYQVIERIGSGGMGAVYRAEPVEGVTRRPVALKLIKRGMDSEDILRRFLRERDILARLEHPHIGRLLDGGMSEGGQPWFAMELVEGEPLPAWCDHRHLSLPARVSLFLPVCEAVAYAHRNLVVHRDIKPGNVLVTDDGQVKLLDFGIAKLLEPGEGSRTRAPMTPEYAAPEQLSHGAITTQTDVFQLGVLLYGHAKNAYWFGSQLSIEETRDLAPHQNATGLQVTSAVLAGMVWALENPDAGIVETDEMDYRRCLAVQTPYLGPVKGYYTDWTPLSDRPGFFPEDIDENDPWQFRNILVR